MNWEKLLNLISSRKNRKIFYITASLVVFFTTYALVLPAITIDDETAANEPGISIEENNPYEETYDPFLIEQEKEAELSQDTATVSVEETDETLNNINNVSSLDTSEKEDYLLFYDDSTDIIVSVVAPKGAFPEGTVMKVTAISSNSVIDTVNNTLESEKKKEVKAVDITFYDMDGNEIEPSLPIQVSFVSDLIKQDAQIIHIDNDGEGSLVEQSDQDSKSNELIFESKDFSTYIVVVETDVITAEGETYTVTVSYNEEAGLPENIRLEAEELTGEEYDTYKAAIENELGTQINYLRLFDISIINKETDEKVQPNDKVKVTIRLDDLNEEKEMKAVHLPDEGELEVIEEVEVKKKEDAQDYIEVSFDTEGFSVYAVVGDGETVDVSRATVNFYGKDTTNPLATVYVKNSDTIEELNQIIIDPGCGELDSSKKELFDGWVISTINTTDGSEYTIETEGKNIEEIREYLADLEISEGDIVNIYAKIVRTIIISYQGENENVLLGTVILKVLGSDDPNDPNNISEYVINMNYTPETSTQAFMGWNVAEGAANILSASLNGETVTVPYMNGTKLTVKGDVKLSVNAPTGHWLVFDENGKGATYNAPRFIKDGEVTTEPTLEMTRIGYSFDGWYKLKEGVDISGVPKTSAGNYIISDDYFESFVFGSELEDNLTVYSKWTSSEKANYTVIVWKERMSDTYAQNGGTGEGKTKNYDFAESYTFTGNVGDIITAVSDGTSSVVDGDDAGTRYYNALIRGTESGGGNVDKTIAYTGYHRASNDTNVEIVPEGTSVVNVYYDRNTVTYTFYTYGQSSSDGTWWLCKEDGSNIVASGSNAPTSGNNRLAIRNGNEYEQYTGRVAYNDGRTYYYSTTGACGGTNMREAHWEFKSNSGSQWNVYQKSTGLYGEPLDWPADTSIWWYEGHNNTSGTGTRMTYKDAFLPLDSDMTVEYWGNTSSATGYIHFWTQDVDGINYTDQVQVNTGNANFNINDKFTGFYAYQYRVDNGIWQNVGPLDPGTGIYGNSVSYQNRLDIRYNRIKAPITFMDGTYFDGSGNIMDETPQAEEFRTTDDYFYGANVSSYNKNGSDYYTPPAKAGYTFAGWYADDACTIEYTFGEMPVSGITVYAKWIKNQYRVFLHPNVPETDTTLSWGSDDQDMNFRVSFGSKVSAPVGTRSEYKFIGWYLDEDCTEVFDADRFVLNDTTVTTPYNKQTDMTDPMNKWGNIEGEGRNSDLTGYNGGDRFWITKRFDLYAKWRAELIGAQGIGILYDANGGYNAPTDTTLYLDNTDTVAQGASTPSDDSLQFLHWVIQRWDSTAGDSGAFVDVEGDNGIVYPGDSFTVLKSNALIEVLEDSTEEDPKYRYTIQLRAEYGPKEEPTPTHLLWYANGGISIDETTDRYEDPALQINEAVDIRSADTFKRDGYQFIGWARIDSTVEGYEIEEMDLTEDDLFLKYEEGKFYAQVTDGSDEWTEVTQIAADEKNPYHDLYAVWKKKTYTVTVIKAVHGIDGDESVPFEFTPSFTGMTGEEYSAIFKLVGNENGADIEIEDETVHYENRKVFIEVPFDTVFSITETEDSSFDVSNRYTVTNADNEDDNKTIYNVANGAEITVKGDVELTVINTRKVMLVKILKTDDKSRPLKNAVFRVTVGETEYDLVSGEDGYLKNEIFADGVLMVPFGSYELIETNAPDGYIPLSSPVAIVVDGSGIHAAPYDVTSPTEEDNFYVVTIPNNPGVVLPNTGGSGTRLIYSLGTVLMITSALAATFRRKNKE